MITSGSVRFVCLVTASLAWLLCPPASAQQYTTIDYPGAAATQAVAIGQDGTVLGTWQDGSGNWHAYLMSDGQYVAFDCQGAVSTRPVSMNSRAEAVGAQRDASGKWRGFYLAMGQASSWEPAGAKCVEIEPKSPLGESSTTTAYGISEAGEIAGGFSDAKGLAHAFLYRAGVYMVFDLVEGPANAAFGITPQGDPFGHMQATGDRMKGWALSRHHMSILDMPPGESNSMTCPFGSNSKGELVGHYQRRGDQTRGMHFKDGIYTSFDVPDSKMTEAKGINDAGVIVGNYTDQSGKARAFMLRR